MHAADLGFLEVGLHPDVFIRHDRQQVGAGLHHLAIARIALADGAADRCMDFAAGQVQFGLGQVGAGIGDLRIEALEFGVQGGDLLALALQVGAGLVDLGAGDMAVRRQGSDPLLRDKTRLAQLLGTAQVQP
ncbi:hypothetical protein D3C76_1232520 [compost metagenome]